MRDPEDIVNLTIRMPVELAEDFKRLAECLGMPEEELLDLSFRIFLAGDGCKFDVEELAN